MTENEPITKKPLIILTGPTAVGKTDLSIELARAVGGQIISADSMQIYKEMDIGTAKVRPEEMKGIRHYLIDELRPDEEFNVVKFKQMAQLAMNSIYEQGDIPFIVGGTGFYIQSVLYDIDFSESEGEDSEYRKSLYQIAQEKGADYLHQMLEEVDPRSANEIHANNVKRVSRALEYYHQTGTCISRHNSEQRKKTSPYDFVYFVLNDDRAALYERIDRRVDQMFEQGLTQEVQHLKQMGYTKDMVSMQGIGYRQMFDYFDGLYSLDEVKETIKRDTRHFAKRQITWFKRESDVTWMNYPDYNNSKDEMQKAMLGILKEKELI